MIFLLVMLSFGKLVYNSYDFYGPLILYLESMDIVEVKLHKGEEVYFSSWANIKDLYLEVDTINDNNEIQTFGPFKYLDGLAGVKFKTKNYTVRMVNEGIDPCKFGVIFEKSFDQDPNNIIDISFPIIDYMNKYGSDSYWFLNSNFFYVNDGPSGKWSLVIGLIGGAIGFAFLIAFGMSLRERCDKCFK